MEIYFDSSFERNLGKKPTEDDKAALARVVHPQCPESSIMIEVIKFILEAHGPKTRKVTESSLLFSPLCTKHDKCKLKDDCRLGFPILNARPSSK